MSSSQLPSGALLPQTISHVSVPRRRWRIAFLLAFGVLVNFFDRINLAVSRDALHDLFGLSLVAFGYLSSAFSWTYALMQMPAGVLLDRLGVRRVGRMSALLWSISSFAAALAPGLSWFFGARLLLGVSESPTFPANAKALGYWFTREERGLATAITDAAAKFSSAIGVPLIGLLLLYFGWRWSFAATGFMSFLYFVLFYVIYRNPSEDKGLSAGELQFILRGGAQPEDRAKAAKGASLGYLSLADLAAQLSFRFSSHGFVSLGFLHQRALVVRHFHRSLGRGMAGGRSHPTRLGCEPGSAIRDGGGNEVRSGDLRRSVHS